MKPNTKRLETQWLRRRRSRRGLTLVEILIVSAVIGLLSLIVIQRFAGIGRRSRESALRGDLKELRTAIEHFEADTGAYPPDLADIMAADGASISADSDGLGRSVDRAGYEGPYLRTGDDTLPNDPFTRADDWDYDNSTGAVHSSSTDSGTDGTDYNTW